MTLTISPKLLRPSVAAIIVLLSACGSDEEPSASSAGAAGDAYPVSIEHKYGTTEIEAEPKRVVTIGFNDHDFALALGVKPVAVREWFGEKPFATWPWAENALGDARPEVLPGGELNMEQIASLDPDLILGLYSGVTKREYETLSRIAPTVTQTDEFIDYGIPWQEQTLTMGRALGRGKRAERLVEDIEGRFAEARGEHPEFEGKSAVFPSTGGDGTFYAYASQDQRPRFLQALGFETPERIDDLAGDQFYVEFSGEQFRLMDQDVTVMYGAPRAQREKVESDPLYERLDVVREGRVVYLDDEDVLTGALSFSSPLSLPYALEETVPRLADAVDGDPKTEVEEAP